VSALLAAILKGFGDFLARLVADWRRDRDLQDKGRAEGSADLNRGIAGVADDQAKNNSVERGGPRDRGGNRSGYSGRGRTGCARDRVGAARRGRAHLQGAEMKQNNALRKGYCR